MVEQFAIILGASFFIGLITFIMYQGGEGYYGEDKFLITRKILGWTLRLVTGVALTFFYTTYISINEFCLFVCGYHFMTSFLSNATYFQLKRMINKEEFFHFFSHSINGILYIGSRRSAVIDLYAFIRILLFVLGYLMVNYEYY